VVRVYEWYDNLIIACVVYVLINECSCCLFYSNDCVMKIWFWMVPNEHILSMFDALHTKCLTKCPNENCIDYWVSLGYGYDVNCSLIKCILN